MARMTKVRSFIGAVFALVVLIVFALLAARVLGWDIPVLRGIAGPVDM